jgi:hypothetical protein
MDQYPYRGARLWALLRYLFTLTALELRFVVCAAKGEEFDGDPNGGRTGDEIDKIKDWERRKIRAGVIVALCAGEVPGLSVPPRRGLRMRGAYVVGVVDLSRAQLSQCPLAFRSCRFEEPFLMQQATTADMTFTSCSLADLRGDRLDSSGSLALTKTHLRRLSLTGAHFRGFVELSEAQLVSRGEGEVALLADDLHATNMFLSNKTAVEGEVRLIDAQIRGHLDCDGARLNNIGGVALFADGLHATSVSLRNDAHVAGEVRLLGTQITHLSCIDAHLSNPRGDALSADRLSAATVFLRDADVEGKVRLSGAKISGHLECDGARLSNRSEEAINANGLSAASVFLRGTKVEGEVRLIHAQIRDTLECDNAHLSNPGRCALNAESITTDNVFIRSNLHVEGEVRLLYARIGGELDCRRANLSNPGGDALSADSLKAGAVFLSGAKVEGNVRLLDAQISTQLSCRDAHLSNPGGAALSAENMNTANVFLSGTKVEGALRLSGAQISGDLDCSGAHLSNGGGIALSAQGCHVGGKLSFQLASRAVGKVDLAYAQLGTLADKLASWPKTFNLVGCSYRALEAKNRDPSQRLKWWLSQSEPFSPDIYSQLAEVYRRIGEEGYARQVAIAREEKRSHEPNLSWWVRAWRRFFGFTVAYGYEPWRALGGLMVLFIVGWVSFTLPPAQAVMVYAPHNNRGPLNAAAPCENYPCFSPPIYTLDTLLPIIDLHQESNWVPATHEPWGLLYETLTWLLIALGWLLTTAIVAGIGSVWRRE